MQFIGRENELSLLEKRYKSNKAELFIVYGRRRVGKTELLAEFAKGKNALFYSAQETTKDLQLASFTNCLKIYGSAIAGAIDAHQSWESALTDFLNACPAALNDNPNAKKLLIIDEFPYLVKGDPSLPSTLQMLWDSTLKHENVMVVLCGSSMSFMEDEVLAEKNPLYGRSTGVLKLTPFTYDVAARFFPKYDAQQKMEAYAILGGVPHYLAQFDPEADIAHNVIDNILQKGCALYSEVEFLLHEELREISLYSAVVRAIAMGASAANEISQKSGVESRKLATYLKNLQEIGIVVREFSAGVSVKEFAKSTRGLYRLSDNFFKFWYRFVFPNYSDLELFDAQGVWDYFVFDELNHYTSAAFEDVCTQWMQRQNIANALPFRCGEIKRWWSANAEIDIVGLSRASGKSPAGAQMILAECKYRNQPVGLDVLTDLQDKSQVFNARKKHYYLFSKSGFTADLEKYAASANDVVLVGLDDLFDLDQS